MDNITHTLFAATLARTPLRRAGRGTTAALLMASNAPDIDIIAAAWGSVSYLSWHRGPTHGLLGIVGLGAATAGLVWIVRAALDRRAEDQTATAPARADQRDASLGMLVVVSLLGVALHVLMDLPTPYGTRLLSPFDWHWFAVDWLPIVDIYLWVALAAGLMFGRRSAATSKRRYVAIVLALMACNYGVRGVAHRAALAHATRLLGPLLPPRCSSQALDLTLLNRWPDARSPTLDNGSPTGCLVQIAAMPTFFSPFRWRIITQLSDAYELRDVDVLQARLQSPATETEGLNRVTVRFPNQSSPAVARAAATRVGRVFLDFSRFPAARSVVNDKTGVTTVRWTDMRFAGGRLALEQPAQPPGPFTALVRIDAGGHIIEEDFGP